jgi:hypothetical protein
VLLKVLRTLTLPVNEHVAVELRQIEIAALPMKLPLGDAMHLAEYVEVVIQVERAFNVL